MGFSVCAAPLLDFPLGWRCVFARRINLKKTPLLSDTSLRYKEEYLFIHWPQNLEEVRRVTEQYQQHYNWERPLKATSVRQSTTAPGLSDPAELTSFTRGRASRSLSGARSHHRIFARLVGADWLRHRPS